MSGNTTDTSNTLIALYTYLILSMLCIEVCMKPSRDHNTKQNDDSWKYMYMADELDTWMLSEQVRKIELNGVETKTSDFYHWGFSDYCLHLYCYFHNVSAGRSSAFFRCLSNSGTCTVLRTTSFFLSTEVACSHSVNHNRVQVLRIPVLLLACSQDWTCKLQMIVSLET